MFSFHLGRKFSAEIQPVLISDDLGRVYGLVSITAEQLLITIGHRLADRFFTLENIPIQFRHISHTGENSNSFPTEVLLLATFYPLLSWLLSPTSLSGSATRLPSQRKGEIF